MGVLRVALSVFLYYVTEGGQENIKKLVEPRLAQTKIHRIMISMPENWEEYALLKIVKINKKSEFSCVSICGKPCIWRSRAIPNRIHLINSINNTMKILRTPWQVFIGADYEPERNFVSMVRSFEITKVQSLIMYFSMLWICCFLCVMDRYRVAKQRENNSQDLQIIFENCNSCIHPNHLKTKIYAC